MNFKTVPPKRTSGPCLPPPQLLWSRTAPDHNMSMHIMDDGYCLSFWEYSAHSIPGGTFHVNKKSTKPICFFQ